MKTYYYTSQTTHYEPYLAHHGVKGMKWGVRHDRERSELRTRYDEAKRNAKKTKRQADRDRRTYEDYNNHYFITRHTNKQRKAQYKTLKNNYFNSAKADEDALDKYRSVKKERKAALKSTRKSIKNNLSTKDKLLYQNSLNNRAAHLIVDNNMKYEDAMKKTRKEAWRNTAIFVAAYGGYQLASAYSRKKSRGI